MRGLSVIGHSPNLSQPLNALQNLPRLISRKSQAVVLRREELPHRPFVAQPETFAAHFSPVAQVPVFAL